MEQHQQQVNQSFARDQKARNFAGWFRGYIKYLRYQYLGPVYRRLITQPPEPVLVICNARTGSNFLLWLLASHPRILHIGEPFGAYKLEKQWVMSRIQEVGSVAYLQEAMQRKGNEQAVIFKMLYPHLEDEHAAKWNLDLPALCDHVVNNPDLKVIHLKRRGRLESLISLRLADVTKQYVLFNPHKRTDDLHIELTPEECEAHFARVAAWERHYDALFAEHPVFEVCYEDLYADTKNQGNRILDFLRVKRRRMEEQTVKQNVRSPREVVTNYNALKAYFTGTVWAGQFDD
jgi:LPS sulfotransferase NodH